MSRPLMEKIEQDRKDKKPNTDQIAVVIDLNFKYYRGLSAAKDKTRELIERAVELVEQQRGERLSPEQPRVDLRKARLAQQYLFAKLEPDVIKQLSRLSFESQEDAPDSSRAEVYRAETEDDQGRSTPVDTKFIFRPVFMIWPDFKISGSMLKSISTVKADAAHRAFSAFGEDVVWAVLDSGVEADHVHFRLHDNLAVENLDPPLRHMDFTRTYDVDERTGQIINHDEERANALKDDFGHGTHVAGIIAGEADPIKIDEAARTQSQKNEDDESRREIEVYSEIRVGTKLMDEHGDIQNRSFAINHISGMAPRCKIVSVKVLDEDGDGDMSNLLAALAQIQEINEHGRWLKIHGVNLSVGYDFEPEWFACGQSPLCNEVNRLVKSGVVVVAAAGNTGYGFKQTTSRGAVASGMMMSINDPGNADLAITVGSTHREMPHVYGVSFFSSKGPTGDGRLKPDMVAPGERIISCGAGEKLRHAKKGLAEVPDYIEDSGTSMAAPHVSGVIAAFLSIRREFIGRPERVKDIFVSSTTDLKREKYMQGEGLVDLMRSIQSV